MSEHVEGIVKAISEKAAGRGTVFNIKVDIDGQEDWFGHGFDKPDFAKGDEIAFDIILNGEYENIDPDSVEILNAAAPQRSSRSSRSSSNAPAPRRGRAAKPEARSGSKRSKPAAKGNDTTMSKDDWAKKDQMIRRQSTMNTAIALVRVLCENDAIKLPAAAAKRGDAIIALCDEEADRLYDQYEEQVYPKPKAGRTGRRQAAPEYDDDIPE